MAATGDGVRAITGTTLDDTALTPFLVSANCIMDDLAAQGCTTGKSTECLDQAANFLAAHFLALSPLGEELLTVKSERFENYQTTRQVGADSGDGLLATSYGKAANALLAGCLADYDAPPAVVQFA